jgi:hypothetical protein
MVIVNIDLKGMWKEPAMAYFKALFQSLLRGTEEASRNLSHGIRRLGPELNLGLPKYDAKSQPFNRNVLFI